MKEILSKLLESNLLTEETVNELEVAITEQLQQAAAAAREEAIVEARAEVASQWRQERETLINAIDQQLTEAINEPVAQLAEAREQFDNLKVELSRRYIRREQELAESVKNEMTTLASELDGFIKEVITAHLATVSEDIAQIKQDQFGRKIFEAVAAEFATRHIGAARIKEIEESANTNADELSAALEENAQLRLRLSEAARMAKIRSLVAPFSGEKRKVMEAILQNVPLNKLDESFKTYLPRVLKESSEKETRVLAEDKKAAPRTQLRRRPATGRIVTGDVPRAPSRSTPDQLVEAADQDQSITEMQRLAGITVKQ